MAAVRRVSWLLTPSQRGQQSAVVVTLTTLLGNIIRLLTVIIL